MTRKEEKEARPREQRAFMSVVPEARLWLQRAGAARCNLFVQSSRKKEERKNGLGSGFSSTSLTYAYL